ncbi:hypothetical protein TrVE_jg3096 [Triparma verrucosa]|uniref:HECT-type E3 ubiquitin transferase n=1 Tax=Triparma verrucosa TaxID=1606542 RepID=A0A9W7AZH1_9STRA|nr:hypothetical protein TrVE_jg3096 [Triparma verrucosa]
MGLLSNLIPFLSHVNLEFLTSCVKTVETAAFEEGSKAVVWVKTGETSSKAVVVDGEVLESVRIIWSDVAVKAVIGRCCYIEDNGRISEELKVMNEEDRRRGKWSEGWGGTAEEMAAREAKKGERRKSWFGGGEKEKGSSWAEKLKLNLFGKKKSHKKLPSALINTSSVSASLASGRTSSFPHLSKTVAEPTSKRTPFSPKDISTITPYLSILISRFTGVASHSTLTSFSPPGVTTVSGSRSFFNYLYFSKYNILQRLWLSIIRTSEATSSDYVVFGTVFLGVLMTTDDNEFRKEEFLGMHMVRRVVRRYIDLIEGRLSMRENECEDVALMNVGLKLLNSLYEINSRRPFCGVDIWRGKASEDVKRRVDGARTFEDYNSILRMDVVRCLPFSVDLRARMKLFEGLVRTVREAVQGVNERGTLKPGRRVKIIRGRVLEGGLETMNKLGKGLRERIVVGYINEAGVEEKGIDVGGLFKDFWSDLSGQAFSPGYSLFASIEGGSLYPSPMALKAHGEQDGVMLFTFLGRIVGKALFENITVQPVFAHFFLSFMRGGYNFNNMLNDLGVLDPELHKNLMFLKNYEGDAEDLCLSFTVGIDDFGSGTEVELVKGGANIDVTDKNKLRYIHLVAKFHMSDRIKKQSEAFVKGLNEVIDQSWLRIFNEQELQILISGATNGSLDLADLKRHCVYAGGYVGMDRSIVNFWKVLEEFSATEQRQLLKFVTSCERAPPLGFEGLQPPFTIQRIGISHDGEKLPSASTCFNVLKLPTYSSKSVLKQKLLMSITSGTGFEMS